MLMLFGRCVCVGDDPSKFLVSMQLTVLPHAYWDFGVCSMIFYVLLNVIAICLCSYVMILVCSNGFSTQP